MMSEWKDVEILGNYIDVINGYAFKSSNFHNSKKENLMPVLKIKNVANGDVHLLGVQYHAYNESLKKYIVSKGDVLIALTGNHPQAMTQVVGDASRYRLDESALLNQRVAKVMPKDSIQNDYLYYFLKDDATHDYLASQSSGSANQANISKKDIENIRIQLPTFTKQKSIANILGSLDDKIDLLHRQNVTLEAMAETLFRQWFVVEAKESWEIVKIGDVLQTVLGGTPSTEKPEYWNGTIPWINSGEVNNFRIFKGSKFITELGLKKSNAKLLPLGTTVLAITGATLGQVSLLEIETCANQSVVGIIPNEKWPKEFVFLWIKLKIKEIILNETGGAQGHINKNDINETDILKPGEKCMVEYTKLLRPIFEKITKNSYQIELLTKLRDTLLPKLMSGEVKANF